MYKIYLYLHHFMYKYIQTDTNINTSFPKNVAHVSKGWIVRLQLQSKLKVISTMLSKNEVFVLATGWFQSDPHPNTVMLTAVQGSQLYLENLENLEFCHLCFQAWKMPEICSKGGKTWNFNSKPGKTFLNSVFKVSIFKVICKKKNNHLHLYHIYIININTVIQSQIDLECHWFYLEVTRKIHGI